MQYSPVAMLMALACAAAIATAAESLPPVDEARARSSGIRKITGRHLTLYTDLAADPEIDRLPAAFDAAVPQWAEYFGVDPGLVATWHARAYVIGERRRFDALGLLPAGREQFANGISVGDELWLHEQPTAYYRRHLLLHEGTHAFMEAFLGGCGPAWYMEGTAELFATHRLEDPTHAQADPSQGPAQLALRIMPGDRLDVPMLGRIKLIRDAVAAGRPLSLPDVLRLDGREQLGNEAYAWCWAAAKFLDAHPRYRERFRALGRHVTQPDFNGIVRREFARDWGDLLAEWQAYIPALDHGYDFERMTIEFKPGEQLVDAPARATISAERGWQSSGAWLEAGKRYRLTASGRYQIAVEQVGGAEQPWPCEPGGVTIEYHDGKPLGILLGAIDGRSDEAPTAGASLADAFVIGLGTTIAPTASGTLYLRVNDAPAKLNDNRGTMTLTVKPVR